MDSILNDLRYAVRTLFRSPGFTLAAGLTLALGIGANTAVFSVVNAVVLRPLPYPDPDRVVYLGWDYRPGWLSTNTTAFKYEYIREHGRVFDGVSTHRAWSTGLGAGAEPAEVRGLRVTQDFFRVNGIQPALGRSFLAEEAVPGGPRVVVLSHELWRTRFAADAGVLGTSIRLGGVPHTVVGVMPAGFRYPEAAGATDFFVPYQLVADPSDRGTNYLARARIRPGVALEQVRADLRRVSEQLKREYPQQGWEDETGIGAVVLRYDDVFVAGRLARTLWILLGSVGFVLLIACANVANLLLARAAGRRREMAIRGAIGAGRGRIVRQLLSEGMVLTLVAAVAGLIIGHWSVSGLLALAPADLPRAEEIGLDGRVLLFTLGVAVATGIVFGLAAAGHAFRAELSDTLREGGSRLSAGRGGQRLRSAFVAAQAGLAVVLLTGAGLLIATFFRLQSVDTGFEPDGLVAVSFPRTPAEYNAGERVWRFQQQLLDRLRAHPDITSAAATSVVPFRNQLNFPMTVAGRPEATRGDVQWRSISPGYFETLGAPIVRGREFTEFDAAGSQPVVIIDQTFARKYFGDEDPVGQRVHIGTMGGREVIPGFDDPERVIVGVVADTRTLSLDDEIEETMYTPSAQAPPFEGLFGLGAVVLRTRGSATIAPAVVAAVRELDAAMPAPRFFTIREAIGASIAQERFNAILLGAFAGLALLLTAIGIYGVVSYTVRQRTGEIGIRIALGASRRSVLGMVLRQAMTPVALGAGAGLVAALALSRLISSLLFGVSPTDPVTITAVANVIAAVALAAIWLPARHAAGVDPVIALKSE